MAATTTDISASPAKPARRRSRLLIAVVTLVVLVALGKTADLIVGRAADSRWQQFRASITASGQPFTFEEIERARATVPAEKNSALLLERLRPTIEAAFANEPPADVLVFTVGDDLMEGVQNRHIAASKEFLAEQAALLEALWPILDMPSGRFPVSLSQPISVSSLIPSDPMHDRRIAQLAELAAMLSLADRRRDDAVRYTLLQFALAGCFYEDSRLLNIRLAQALIAGRAVHSVRQLLRTGYVNAATVSRLEHAIDERLVTDKLRWSLLGERAFVVDMLEQVEKGIQTQGVVARPWLARMTPGLTRSEVRNQQIRTATWLGWLIDAGEDRPAVRTALARIDADMRSGESYLVLHSSFMPHLGRAADLHFRSVAELRAARAALAAERYRMKFNKLPKSFDELVPEFLAAVPEDPFSSGPLQIKTTTTGIDIVSALMDDGSGANPPAVLGDPRTTTDDDHTGHDHGHQGHDHAAAPGEGSVPQPHRHVRPPQNIGVTVFDARFRGIMTIGDE